MELKLPKKTNSDKSVVIANARQVTIIGANGSGKSRFTQQLIKECGNKAFVVSALRAIYDADNATHLPVLEGSITSIFNSINASNPQVKNLARTEFDQLTYVMLIEEFHELMNYKTHLLMDDSIDFPKTKLDKVVKRWQEVFPRNKVLRENGKLLFSTQGQSDTYSLLRLSDGEKAVLYYLGAVLYAMDDAVIFVDSPETFIHPSIMRTLWDVIEEMRPDCTFVYNTHDVDFAATRFDNKCVWVKNFNPEALEWDYEVLDTSRNLNETIYIDLLGARKPVLFIEGDESHSIDSHLYPLIFPEYVVKPLGSCDKVIESVRTFASLEQMHHVDSRGIVDRDRRTDKEVEYLRNKKIMVPEVAEIENIFMLETVIRTVAAHRHKNENDVFFSVKHNVLNLFQRELKTQALQHVRHRVKHDVEKRIDMRFRNISALEDHMIDLVNELDPRTQYEKLCREFHRYVSTGDYNMVLRVFNHKQMLAESQVAPLCGLKNRDEYIRTVLNLLKHDTPQARVMREAIRTCLKA